MVTKPISESRARELLIAEIRELMNAMDRYFTKTYGTVLLEFTLIQLQNERDSLLEELKSNKR